MNSHLYIFFPNKDLQTNSYIRINEKWFYNVPNMVIYLVARVDGDDRDAILIMNDHMG